MITREDSTLPAEKQNCSTGAEARRGVFWGVDPIAILMKLLGGWLVGGKDDQNNQHGGKH